MVSSYLSILLLNLVLVFLKLVELRIKARQDRAQANVLLIACIQELMPSARGWRLWILQVMEISGRDALILHIFGSIR